MGDKKSYTSALVDVLSELGELKAGISEVKTISEYQENHLGNIDKQLEKLNTRTDKNEVKIALIEERISERKKRRTERIILWGKIAGGILSLAALVAVIIFGLLNLF